MRTKDCSEMESGRLWINEIERDRFVVIRIKDSEELKATGRIVVTPSGVYTYCFKSSKSEHIGSSEGHLGKLFFHSAMMSKPSSLSDGRPRTTEMDRLSRPREVDVADRR